MKPHQALGFHEVNRFLDGLFDGDLHAKRVLSLANATLGVIRTASLAVNTIGQGLALARGLVTKPAIKPVDRLLSNQGIGHRCGTSPLGSLRRGAASQHQGSDGLDRLRRRWPDHHHAVADDPARPRHPAGMAHGRHRHAQEPSKRV
jgi:hypothetical protein